MSCFLLVSLSECIPVFSISVDVIVASDKRFFLVDSDDLDNFCPLISDIAFIVSFDYCGFDVVEVVDSVGHLHIVIELDFTCTEHIAVVAH